MKKKSPGQPFGEQLYEAHISVLKELSIKHGASQNMTEDKLHEYFRFLLSKSHFHSFEFGFALRIQSQQIIFAYGIEKNLGIQEQDVTYRKIIDNIQESKRYEFLALFSATLNYIQQNSKDVGNIQPLKTKLFFSFPMAGPDHKSMKVEAVVLPLQVDKRQHIVSLIFHLQSAGTSAEGEQVLFNFLPDGKVSSPNTVKAIMKLLHNPQSTAPWANPFTYRELWILTLVDEGMTAKEIYEIVYKKQIVGRPEAIFSVYKKILRKARAAFNTDFGSMSILAKFCKERYILLEQAPKS